MLLVGDNALAVTFVTLAKLHVIVCVKGAILPTGITVLIGTLSKSVFVNVPEEPITV
jgi:hypothetical protein